jgi:hypothetical protein
LEGCTVSLQTLDPGPGHHTARIVRPKPAEYAGQHRRRWFHGHPFLTAVFTRLGRAL